MSYEGGANAYRLEYAKSRASYCVGPCQSRIDKGVLRFGSPVMFGNVTYKWRHMSCITEKVLENLQGKIGRHGLDTALSGLHELTPEDRERVMCMLGEEGLDAVASSDEEPEEEAGGGAGHTQDVTTPTGRPKRANAGKRKIWAAEQDDDEDHKHGPTARRRA